MYIYIYTHIYIYIYPLTRWVARCVYHDVGCSEHMLVFWGMDCFNSLCVHSPTLLGPMVTHPLSWEPTRTSGPSWSAVDIGRTALGATTMQFLACILYVKGDWAEYAGTLGLPNWMDGLRPCFGCNCDLDDMYDLLVNLSASHTPFTLNEAGDYDVACDRCERLVELQADTHAAVLNVLQYDKRKQGSRGRALTANIPELDLV